MEPNEFNQFVAALWESHGWKVTSDTDGGVVLAGTANSTESQYVIHTAEYRTTEIDGECVARYAQTHESSEHGTPVIVTTGQFSWEAQERADIWNVKLVDGDDLISRINATDSYDIVNTYSPVSVSSHSATELEAYLDKRERRFGPDQKTGSSIETQPARPLPTLLPGVSLEQNWIRRFVVLLAAVVALVPVYNALPAGGPVTLRLARTAVSFALLGGTVGIFISFYMDMKLIQRADTSWNPRPFVYLTLVPFTFGVVWLLYFYKRQYHFGGVLAAPALAIDAPLE